MSLDPRRELLISLLGQAQKRQTRPDIAIIGVAGRYPGSSTLGEFWRRLEKGEDSITEMPEERWPRERTNKSLYTRWGGFLDDVDLFDPLLFRLSPRDACAMDPQSRLFLEIVWETLEDAGYTRAALSKAGNVGVFTGVMNANYGRFGVEAFARGEAPAAFSDHHAVANRVSWCFDFTGPSLAVDTACSSSLTALHLACRSIQDDDCATAIAGGVNLILHPMHYARLCSLGMLASDGKLKAFSDDADGFVDGEGVGAVLLKSLPRAEADGDRIYAVIRGSAVNAGGRTSGFTVPSIQAQADLIAEAIGRSGVDARTISFVEAHGTGTRLGDPIEVTALTQAFRRFTNDRGFCVIGTVKSNIGHLESAAGIAGLTRILLQMRHHRIAPSINISQLNPKIDFENSPFVVRTTAGEWTASSDHPLRASVSSFGAGGANGHLVVEEYRTRTGNCATAGPYAIPISAASVPALRQCVERLADFVRRAAADGEPDLLPRLAATLQFGREPLEERLAITVSSAGELIAGWEAYLSGAQQPLLTDGPAARWMSGQDVDWRARWQGPVPRLLDAPHYPFARERCWFEAPPGSGGVTFSAREALIRDHVVGGRPIVPGAALVTAARKTCGFAETDAVEFSGLTWSAPLAASPEASADIKITPQGEAFAVEVRNAEVVYSRCSVRRAGSNHERPRCRIAEVRARCPESVTSDEAYERFAASGVNYGPSFRGLRTIHRNAREVLAEFHIPDCVPSSERCTVALDLTLQSLGGLIDQSRAAITVPVGIRNLVLRKTVPQDGVIHAVIDEDDTYRAELLTSDGESRIECSGIRIAKLTNREPAGGFFYVPQWELVRDVQADRDEGANLVLIAEASELSALADRIESLWTHSEVVRYRAGERIPKLDGRIPDLVYFLGGFTSSASSVQTIEDRETASVAELMHLVQGFAHAEKLRLVVIANQVHALSSGENPNPLGAGAIGFARAAAHEFPNWAVTSLEVCPEDVRDGLADPLLRNAPAGDYALRETRLYRQSLVPIMLPHVDHTVFRRNGVYVIVGGAGGLGCELSKYLGSGFDARIVWTGRRPEDAAIRSSLETVRELGGDATYVQADAADREAMRRAFEAIRQRHGVIHGVFHSAIVLDDCLIGNMNKTRLLSVLRPKVSGCMVLTEVLAQDELDFLVFFSSAQSFTCSAGQSNYAAASVFEDVWARYTGSTRKFPVITVNWGYWRGVGVVGGPAYETRLRSLGVLPIEPADGISALVQIIASRLPQVAALRLDPEASKAAGLNTRKPRHLLVSPVPSPLGEQGTRAAIDAGALARYREASEALRKAGHAMLRRAWPDPNADPARGATARYRLLAAEIRRILDGASANASVEPARQFGELEFHLELLERCVKNLPAVIVGRKDHQDVLISGGNPASIEKMYRGNVVADYTNRLVASLVRRFVNQLRGPDPGRAIRVIEVGAGTGATSRCVLPELAETAGKLLRYIYTDLSPVFVQHGRRILGAQHSFAEFREFDLERDPTDQGFEVASADVVIAANVVHATRDIQATLARLKRLLRPGGLLVLNEGTRLEEFATLTFGMTEGWWLFEDAPARIPNSPLLSTRSWIENLSIAGFLGAQALEAPNATPEELGSAVLAGVSDGVVEAAVESAMRAEAVPAEAARAEECHTPMASSDALAYVCRVLGEALGIDPGRLSPDATLDRYGADSLIVLAVNKRLEQDLGRIPESLLYEHNTPRKLAAWINANRPGIPAPIADTLLQADVSAHVQDESVPNLPGAVAIIGLAGRYPMAADPWALGANLREGRHCIREIPPERWDWQEGGAYSKWGGFVDDIDKFDPRFFHISPKEAARMDPQERLFLETAWHVLEDGGYPPAVLEKFGREVGVFAGVMNNHYALLGAGAYARGDSDATALSSPWSVANRVSWHFNLSGPSMAVDTACSSSLTAIHLACESLRRSECRMSIAGGVNLLLHPLHFAEMCAMNMLSHDAHCNAFGESADGFVDGEGVGAVLLKRLEDAVADGDRIYAVIRGSAINAGGRTAGYTVPNPSAQADVVTKALVSAGVDARTISCVEAHGTGTRLGDAIEIAGLNNAFRKGTSDIGFCSLGSLKVNIGHLESAAGIAGLTKVLLMLQALELFPMPQAGAENPKLALSESPFYLQRTAQPWKVEGPRRAAVSSFGAGGANAHLIVEEFPRPAESKRPAGPFVFPLSAKDGAALQAQVSNLVRWLQQHPDAALADIAFTLQVGREPMDHRSAAVASTREELMALLQRVPAHEEIPGKLHFGKKAEGTANAGLLGDDEVRELILTWLAKGKLGRLAQVWAGGAEVAWRDLPGIGGCRLLSLPGYPFARERHWYHDAAPRPGMSQPVEARLHPLVHRNISTLQEQVFASELSEGDALVRDHRVNGTALLPGAACFEMARVAAELSCEKPVTSVRDMVWVEPLAASPGKQVRIRITPAGNDVAIEIRSRDQAGKETVHARAWATPGELTDAAVEPVPLEAIRARCRSMATHAECYDTFSRRGVEYGPSLRAIRSLAYNNEEVLAELDVSAAVTGRYCRLIPEIIDAAFTAVGPLLLSAGSDGIGVWVPSGACQLSWSRSSKPPVWTWITRTPQSLTFDIRFADENGVALGRIEGFSLRPAVASTGPAEVFFVRPHWEDAALPPDKNIAGPVLLFDFTAALHDELAALLKATPVILFEPDFRYEWCDEKRCILDARQENCFDAAIAAVRERFGEPRAVVFHGDAEPFLHQAQHVKALVENNFLMARRLCRALITAGVKHFGFVFASDGGEDGVRPHHSAFAAFSRSLMREEVGAWFRTLYLTDGSPRETANAILNELRHGCRNESEIRLSGGKRQKRTWMAADLPHRPVPLASEQAYVITGGLGGVGLAIAERLAKKYRARLLLVGRSAPAESAAARLDRLSESGAVIHTLAADVSEPEGARLVISEAKKLFGAVAGIIHAAGVLRDGLLMTQDESAAREVLAPKVAGAALLDEASEDEALGFFAMFSSFVVAAGNSGQADYSWANGFLDSFAEWRENLRSRGERRGITVSIAWPAWRTGGMQMDSQLARRIETRTGLVPLDEEAGCDAFERALAAGLPRILVACGERSRVEQLWREQDASEATAAVGSGSVDAGPYAEALRLVRAAIAGETGASEDSIQPDGRFEIFGIDSVAAVRIAARLEERFGELSKTLLYEHQTVRALAADLAATRGAMLAGPRETTVPCRVPAAPLAAIPGTEPITEMPVSPSSEPIAIIGVSARFPMAADLEEFARNLREGRDCVTEIPADRWDHAIYYDPVPGRLGKTYSKWGGFLDDIARFDAEFFRVNPREAEVIDPQERLFLETAWAALEDAGYTAEALASQTVGVFAGVMYAHYPLITGGRPGANGSTPGSSFASIANRVSYQFDFRGPSMAVDSMCSSSLSALQLAVESLRRGESTVALAGGVNLCPDPGKYLLLCQGRFASTDGRCRSFGEGGDGYVPGEGVGVVILKPLRRAIEDRDHVHAVIRGIAVNHGGRTNGYTVPNPRQQAAVIRKALDAAGWSPASVSYVEAHGTGTPLGDPIELKALSDVFAGAGEGSCAIGSVKSNIGHLEAASGMASLAKVLVQLKHGFLSPSLHAERTNPNLDFAGTPFQLQREFSPWTATSPRRAGISSFGAGGSNAHVLIEEFDAPRGMDAAPDGDGATVFQFPVSAADDDRLVMSVRRLFSYLEKHPEVALRDVSFTLIVGRELLAKKCVFEATTRSALLEAMQSWMNGDRSVDAHAHATEWKAPADGRRVSLPTYPFGGGSHWIRPFSAAVAAERSTTSAVYLTPSWEPADLATGRPAFRRLAIQGDSGIGLQQALERLSGLRVGLPGERPDFLVIDGLAIESGRTQDEVARRIHSAVAVIRNLLANGAEPVRVVHVHRKGNRVSAALGAFLKTLEREAREFSCTVVELEGERPVDEIAAIVLNEASAETPESDVRYEGRQRFSRRMRLWKPHQSFASAIRRGGVYVIAGAPRGLGGIVARYLARKYQAKLVLAGRAELSSEISDFLRHLAEFGAEAVYVRADISRRHEAEHLVHTARTRFGVIHGVIHSAGVLHDGPIRTKTEADMDAVFGPKILGASFLSEAVTGDSLDFFVMFSSAVALLGNPLQSDHAMANAYMDALAATGRGPFISINWPLWLEGGTRVPEAIRREMAARTGLTELSTAAGLEAFEAALRSSQPQIAVVSGSEEKAVDLFAPRAANQAAFARPQTAAVSVDPARAEAWLCDVVSESVGIARDSIEAERSFADYGFDSITVGHFHGELEKYFGELPKTTLLEYPSIRELAGYLLCECPAILAGLTGEAQTPPEAPRAPAIVDRNVLVRRESGSGVGEPIAIVGAAGRFPGAANLNEYWKNLSSGRVSTTEVPGDRWDVKTYFSADPADAASGKIYCRYGGFLSSVDKFDPLFFRMTPLEAEMANPEDRLLLETVWRAFESGGIVPASLDGRRVDVYVGQTTNTYPLLGVEPGSSNVRGSLDGAHFRLPNRISHFFNFTGASMAVDTACSSSLLAVHLACQSIRSGECEAAIAGGVNLYLHPSKYQNLCRGRLISSRSSTGLFEADADGFLPGEGVGAILLKPLSAAVRDRDHVFGVVRGSASINKGKGAGALLPSPAAYAEVIRRALRAAAVEPSDIAVLEAQALGSVLTDSTEWIGLQQAFAGVPRGNCSLSSVKPNIGHLEAASGMAQLCKMLLQLQHEQLTPTILADKVNPEIVLETSPFHVPQTLTSWGANAERPRLAGITSFGAGGTGVHVILSDHPRPAVAPRAAAAQPELIVLSARTDPALSRTIASLRSFVSEHPEVSLPDLAFTLQTGRAVMEHRFAVAVGSREELLDALAQGTSAPYGSTSETRQWVASGSLPVQRSSADPSALRIPVPGVEFDRRRIWLDSAAAAPVPQQAAPAQSRLTPPQPAPARSQSEQRVAEYYDRLLTTFGASEQPVEEYLTFAPFDEVIPGFSSLLTFAEPEARRDHYHFVLGRHQELRRVTFRDVDFSRVRRVFDIGCGLGTDLIQLARAHQHVTCDGFTITPNQAAVAAKRAANAGLADRVRIHLKNSAIDPFPDVFDLVIGFEVTFHIAEKRALFDNIAAHLRPGGYLVLADVVARTAANVNMPTLGQFTCTERQFAWLLAESRLRLRSCVDCSPEIANFLEEPNFEGNLARLCANHPELKMAQKEHRGWHHFGKALRAELFRYLLLSAVRVDDGADPAELVESNMAVLKNTLTWKQGSLTPPPSGNAAREIEEKLVTIVSRVLRMNPGELDSEARFAEMGIDSLQGLQVLDAVNRAMGLELQVQTMYDYSSVRDLSRFLASQHVSAPALRTPEPEMAPRSRTAVSLPAVTGPAPVAIIGMAGRFPGARNVEEFRANLWAGVDSVGEVPRERWDPAEYYHPDRDVPGRTYGKWGGFIDGVAEFDPLFFRISPTEARLMDPQQRIFLETCWNALEDAGYSGRALDGAKCGVFVGVLNNDYQHLLAEQGLAQANAQAMLGNSASILAARISYFLNLKGPAASIDTACSSSLVAIHMACSALRSGEADMMLAGGVTLYLSHKSFVMMSKAGMLSPTGRCRSFDQGADGMVPGEAAGVVVLKLLDRAIADGDHVLGIIRGSGVNQDGRTNGITAPSAESQASLLTEIYERFHVDPAGIGMIECHGTGTPLGDPIEIAALTTAFRRFTQRAGFCAIGSVKSNIGHTSAAAGVVGLIKLLLALQRGEIPPSLHFRAANQHIDFASSPFVPNTELRRWAPPSPGHPRLGALSSFGFSGTNAHLVIEEFQDSRPRPANPDAQVLPLSAGTPEQLSRAASQLAGWLRMLEESSAEVTLQRAAWTLQGGRQEFAHRAAVVARSLSAAAAAFERIGAGKAPSGELVIAAGDAVVSQPAEDYGKRWLRGETVNWRLLHPNGTPVKISLPAYPFNRMRCWFDGSMPGGFGVQPAEAVVVSAHNPLIADTAGQTEIGPEIDNFFFIPRWAPAPRLTEVPGVREEASGTVLVIYPPGFPDIAAAVRTWYPKQQVIGLSQFDDASIISKTDVTSVWFLSGLRRPGPAPLDAASLFAAETSGVIAFHRLVTALRERLNSSITVRVATNDVFSIGADVEVQPHFAALQGIARSLAVEHPNLRVVCLDLTLADTPAKPSPEQWQSILQPLYDEPALGRQGDIAVRSGRRYLRSLQPIRIPPGGDPQFRSGGVYLIAGGFGGVGVELCHWLASCFAARLAVTGRGPLDARKRALLASIESRGGEAIYIQADCSNSTAMRAAVDAVRTRFGRIDVAIHAALELNRQPLQEMPEESLRAVMAPKVAGAIRFYEAVANERLHLLVYFSSLQSFTAVEGRGHYAAACTFLDAWAERLASSASFPVQVVNWGFWDVNNVPLENKQRLARQGIGFFRPAVGLECLSRVLSSGLRQVIPVEVDQRGIRLLGGDRNGQMEVAPGGGQALLRRAAPPEPRAPRPDLIAHLRAAHLELERYCRLRLLQVFQQMGAFVSPLSPCSRQELGALIRLHPSQARLLDPMLQILQRARFVAFEGSLVWPQTVLDSPGLKRELAGVTEMAERLVRNSPEIEAHLHLAAACLDGLPRILRGDVPATQILFPGASTRLVEGVYRDNEISSYFNGAAASAVAAFVEARLGSSAFGEKVRILEVGAGTGGASAGILEALKPFAGRVAYDYTDISMAFANHGRTRFGAACPFASFKVLNIEKDLRAQGFEPRSYDVVVAANVLHATRDIRRTIEQVKTLLRASGWLVLYEVTRRQDIMTLTFGLLDGWWLFEDREERIPGSPLLSVDQWTRLLAQQGFRDAVVYRGPRQAEAAEREQTYQTLILGESDGVLPCRHSVEVPALCVPEAKIENPAIPNSPERTDTTLTGCAVERATIECILRVLNVPEAQFSLDLSFGEMGVDSILAIDLINAINDALQLQLRATDMFHYPTPRALCEFLTEHCADNIQHHSEPQPESSEDDFAAELRSIGQTSKGGH